MIVALFAATILSSSGEPPIRPIADAKTAIRIARQACWKHEIFLFGDWHASLENGGWHVWFGKDPKQPVCNDWGAVVAADGSKTDCVVTVC
jgi:hypothetical protein